MSTTGTAVMTSAPVPLHHPCMRVLPSRNRTCWVGTTSTMSKLLVNRGVPAALAPAIAAPHVFLAAVPRAPSGSDAVRAHGAHARAAAACACREVCSQTRSKLDVIPVWSMCECHDLRAESPLRCRAAKTNVSQVHVPNGPFGLHSRCDNNNTLGLRRHLLPSKLQTHGGSEVACMHRSTLA